MFVSAVRLVNFRSYRDATVALQPGLNIVAGENATGKTNLLEGAFFALRAASPRSRPVAAMRTESSSRPSRSSSASWRSRPTTAS